MHRRGGALPKGFGKLTTLATPEPWMCISSWLRRALEDNPRQPEYILTERSVGLPAAHSETNPDPELARGRQAGLGKDMDARQPARWL